MTRYNQAREIRIGQIMKEYNTKKKLEKKSHTPQELFNDYKEEMCSNCANKNSKDCEILIKNGITVVCENYKKEN
ncbi:MAG: hypothetical protein IKE01_06565 [Clostridia bacterium]|nr:hypothetical protein [Clostridia bacterium]